MLKKTIQARLKIDNKTVVIECGQRYRNDDFYTDFHLQQLASGIFKLQLLLHVKRPLVINSAFITIALDRKPLKSMLANGYQSWSGSKFYSPKESIPRLANIAKPFFRYYGDEHLQYKGIGKDYLHSWTFTKLQFKDSKTDMLLASSKEELAFTYFSYQKGSSTLCIGKDLKDYEASYSLPLFEILIGQCSEESFAKEWAEQCDYPERRPLNIKTAWNSWYKYQQDISVDKVRKLLKNNKEQEDYDLIQLDDGYQKAIGDWLDWKEDFKEHMGLLVSEIRAKKAVPGIWLAPFICETKSTVYKNHPDWMLKDTAGKPIKAGYNGVWKSWYYALDISKKAVQDYLRKVFFILRKQYGFKVFKVDFLFAACIQSPAHQSSAQRMRSAMELLRDCVGEDVLLACGGPLASCFGLVDICRIGPDTHLQWDFNLLKTINKRERPSNYLSLHSIINRNILGRYFFHNDPDVYILRNNNKQEGLSLSKEQKRTLLFLNKLLGAVHFSSDDPQNYTEEQERLLYESKHLEDQTIPKIIHLTNDCYRLESEEGQTYFINLSNQTQLISFKGSLQNIEAYQFLSL